MPTPSFCSYSSPLYWKSWCLVANSSSSIRSDLVIFRLLVLSKFDCLVHEMLLIRERQPSLNKQSDSIRAKVFV